MSNPRNQREARKYIENKEIFRIGNVFSEKDYCGSVTTGYIVYSYGKHYPMFYFNYRLGQWYENFTKYSVSTTRQHSMCRPIGLDIIELSQNELEKVIQGEYVLARAQGN